MEKHETMIIEKGFFETVFQLEAMEKEAKRGQEVCRVAFVRRGAGSPELWGGKRGGGGSGDCILLFLVSFRSASMLRTAKWVPTSELAPLVPLVGSSSFAENSIIMIAYDVNDARRQQLFPSERTRGAAGLDCCPSRRDRVRQAGREQVREKFVENRRGKDLFVKIRLSTHGSRRRGEERTRLAEG